MQQKHFAVVGHPIGHTMSPFIHRRLFPLAGVNGTYTKLDIPPQELSAQFTGTLRQLSGFNVTIPHKQAILPLLDQLEGDAARFGSVNTVAVRDGQTIGCTTDGIGFLRALKTAGIPLQGQILLLGSGGVAHVLANEVLRAPNVTGLTVLMRRHTDERPDKNDSAADAACKKARRGARETAFLQSLSTADSGVPVRVLDSAGLSQDRTFYDLLINGTSAGMYPNLCTCPVSREVIARCKAVFDAVYNPGVTILVKMARDLGKPAASGMGMLVWQAAAAEEFWFSCRFDTEKVRPIIGEAEQAMRQQFGNIVLCGFMGCGKSTVGKLLAARTGRQLVDTDRWIEKQEGRTVSQLFAEHGEKWFRQRETELCRTLSRRTGLVIATGGDVLANPLNACILRETCTIVLLQPPYEVIAHRLSGDHSRPLLEGPDKDAVARRLYDQRMPLYQAAADFAVHAEDSRTAAEQIYAVLSDEE